MNGHQRVFLETDLSTQPVNGRRHGLIEELLECGCEGERLDFKQTFALKKYKRQSTINLVCHIVSMANTEGGYLVYGVRDNHDGTFTPIGISLELCRLLTAEWIQVQLQRYVEGPVGIAVWTEPVDEHVLLCISVERSPVPLPFKMVGEYMGRKDKMVTKFHEGDILVRHGALTEKARYQDLARMFERIREDERKRVTYLASELGPVLEKLDLILNHLGKIDDPEA